MKEKTFKDLGLDNGDDYLKQVSMEFDLGEFENIITNTKSDKEDISEKIENIKKDI